MSKSGRKSKTYQVSILSLLAFTALVAVGTGVYVNHARQARKIQELQEIVEVLKKSYQREFPGATQEDFLRHIERSRND